MYQYKITYNSTTTTLSHAPAGWNDLGISFKRHSTYHSVFRSFTLGIRFPIKSGSGGDIIKTAYEAKGLSADVEVQILKRNPQTDAYDSFYVGIIDFKTYIEERDFIEVALIDGLTEDKFISREEIEYDLRQETSTDDVSITPFISSPIVARLKPIDIYLWGEFSMETSDVLTPGLSPYSETVFAYNTETDINYIGDRIDPTSFVKYINDTGQAISLDVRFSFSTDLYLAAGVLSTTPHTYTYNHVFKVYHYDSGDVELESFLLNSKSLSNTQDFEDGITPGETQLYDNTGSFNESMYFEDGDYLVIKTAITGTFSNAEIEYTYENLLTDVFIIEKYPSPLTTSNCDSFLPYEAFTRLIQLMTSETNTAKLLHSDFFGRTDSEFQTYASNGTGSQVAITNGYNIRKYPTHPIVVSMSDLFKSMDSVFNLGLWYDRVNERFIIEEKAEFYKNTEIFYLGEVAKLIITPIEDKYYSTIKFTSKETVKYEEIQGALEFNTPTEYSSPIPVKTTLDNQGSFNLDSVGIELARRKNYMSTGAEDTSYDDKNYLIYTKKVGSDYISKQGSDYYSVAGFIGIEDYYNIDLSPKRNLLRWGNVLSGMMWKNTTDKIKFSKSQKNIDVVSELVSGDGSIQELTDVAYADLDPALFVPEQYEFEAPITRTQIAALNSDPHGYITFNFEGVERTGFILSIETEDYNEKAKWTLIRKA